MTPTYSIYSIVFYHIHTHTHTITATPFNIPPNTNHKIWLSFQALEKCSTTWETLAKVILETARSYWLFYKCSCACLSLRLKLDLMAKNPEDEVAILALETQHCKATQKKENGCIKRESKRQTDSNKIKHVNIGDAFQRWR